MISINATEIPLNKALQWANDQMTRAMLGAQWPKLLTDIDVDYGLMGPWDNSISCAIDADHDRPRVEAFPGRPDAKPLCLDCAIRHSLAFGPGDIVPLVSR